MTYQPKTGARCSCRRGLERDNCPSCEGTGWVIDFRAVRAQKAQGAPGGEGVSAPPRRVVVTVYGGVADVYENDGVEVVIVDYDHLNAGDGTGGENCPCRLGPDDCDVCARRRAAIAKAVQS